MANTILGKLLIQIAGNTVELNKALNSTEKQISGFQKSVSATNKLLSQIGLGIGIAGVLSVFKGGINIIKDFEKQMSEVRAITGATDSEFERLRKSALELGRTTKFTSQEVAQLQTEFGRLGFSTQEILDATEATINLSIATGSDLARAADVAGSTVRGFGLNANETKRVVDVMAESFNKSALGLENFSEAMKYVAPVAKQAGLTIEQTTALLGTLADAGIRGSQAGTSLRKIISDLGSESGDLSERIAKLAAKGLTGAEAMSEVGRTAYASLLVLAENTKKTDELTVALNNAAGAGERAAKIMGDNLSGDLDELDSAYEGFVLTMSSGASVLRDIVQAGTSVIQMLSDQEKGVGKLVSMWLTALSTVPRAIAGIAGVVKAMTSEVGKPLDDIAEKIAIVNARLDEARRKGDTELASNLEAEAKALTALQGKVIEQATEQLRKLNEQRQEAQERGDIDTVLELNKAIDELQQTYGFLGLTIQGVNEDQTANVNATKEATKVVTEQLGIIGLLEKTIKDFEEKKKKAFSIEEIARFNDKIKELKEELDLLNSTTENLSGFGKKVINAEAGTVSADPLDIATPEGLKFEIPPVEPPDMSQTIAAFDAVQKKYQETGIIAYNENQQMAKAWELQIEKQMEAAAAAQEYGSVIGESLGQAISGQMSFADAMKKLTAQLLQTFLARALGGIIASAATSGGPPPVAIALAAAGVAAISAMFAKIGGPSKSVSGSIPTPTTDRADRMTPLGPSEQIVLVEVEGKVSGNDIDLVQKRTAKAKQITG